MSAKRVVNHGHRIGCGAHLSRSNRMVLRVGPSSNIGFEFAEVTRLDRIEHPSAEGREPKAAALQQKT